MEIFAKFPNRGNSAGRIPEIGESGKTEFFGGTWKIGGFSANSGKSAKMAKIGAPGPLPPDFVSSWGSLNKYIFRWDLHKLDLFYYLESRISVGFGAPFFRIIHYLLMETRNLGAQNRENRQNPQNRPPGPGAQNGQNRQNPQNRPPGPKIPVFGPRAPKIPKIPKISGPTPKSRKSQKLPKIPQPAEPPKFLK